MTTTDTKGAPARYVVLIGAKYHTCTETGLTICRSVRNNHSRGIAVDKATVRYERLCNRCAGGPK